MKTNEGVNDDLERKGFGELKDLALNLHWSWSRASDELWERLDSELWEATQDPWVILQTVSKETILQALGEPQFSQRLADVLASDRAAYANDAWFQKTHKDSGLTAVAYFSMEFMLSEALPIYSGGLGNVAGDQMKSASDLGVPVVGVGLLYGQGYFRQQFDSAGRQRALYPVNDPGQLPIRPLRRANGEWLRLKVPIPGVTIWLRCWEVSVGRAKLYLLDSNDFANAPEHRCVTSQLYGGDAEMRLKQELVLGIGGWRLLRAIGIQPEVCHLNEGHAAFAVLERARSYMQDHGVGFDVALSVTRAGNLFTTHTAVAAGFDRFDPELIRRYMTAYASRLGISINALLAMGKPDTGAPEPPNSKEPFNMAYLAMHGSGQVNAVSELHGEVSREIFGPLFLRWPKEEVPVGSVTNGVHVPTWESEAADTLWSGACGDGRWLGTPCREEDVRGMSDEALWAMRTECRKRLVEWLRTRYARQLALDGEDPAQAASIFREDVLTIGFARRFATYKRPDLLLHDPDRLLRLLTNPERPMQLVLAGKAHPQDMAGQALIEKWNKFLKREDARSKIIFLSDYDMRVAKEMVQGIDLWINTPRRPWEASGTSGMKVLVNGGLNLSELDGWWAEAYVPEVGWALGDGKEHSEGDVAVAELDAIEADAMYRTLETEVAADFYTREGIAPPAGWVARMRESMAQLTERFSAARTIREYTEEHYIPAARGYGERSADSSAMGAAMVAWREEIDKKWAGLRFGAFEMKAVGTRYEFKIEVFAGELSADTFKVEVYVAPGWRVMVSPVLLNRSGETGSAGAMVFTGSVAADLPEEAYIPRVVPYFAGASVPLEAGEILWQR